MYLLLLTTGTLNLLLLTTYSYYLLRTPTYLLLLTSYANEYGVGVPGTYLERSSSGLNWIITVYFLRKLYIKCPFYRICMW
jgi:hypothetical protein